MSAYPDDGHHFTGCFSRGRRTPSQGNGSHSHRSVLSLPPFSVFRSSRPTGRLLSSILTTLVNFSFTLSFHSPAEHSHSYNQNSSQPERRNEYNDPLNDPSSTWSNYNTSRLTSMLIVLSNSLPFLVGQQPAFPNDDDPRLQYSYPAPQQVPQPYQPYRDPSTSYSNHPTILPPINVSGSHPRDERWQQNPYGGTSAANRIPEPDFSPVTSYPPGTPFQYPPQHPSQGMLPDTRFTLPVNASTSASTGPVRRGPALVERSRSTAHATSPYSRHPPAPDATQEHPPPKKKRKRADAEQLRVLNEVYARTAFPSTEERQELALKLNMTPRSVQIWYASYFLHHRPLTSYLL